MSRLISKVRWVGFSDSCVGRIKRTYRLPELQNAYNMGYRAVSKVQDIYLWDKSDSVGSTQEV